MKILPDSIEFEWDKGNIDKNLKKHGVCDKESEEVFYNKPVFLLLDVRHSTRREIRYYALGKTNENKILFLSFTVRKNRIRIISSRLANKKERKIYVEKKA